MVVSQTLVAKLHVSLFHSHSFPLLQSSVPSTRWSCSWTSRTQLPSDGISSRTTLVWIYTSGCSPSGMDSTSIGSAQGPAPSKTPILIWSPLHAVLTPNLIPWALSTGLQLPSDASAPPWVPLWAEVWRHYPLWYTMNCRWTACSTMVLWSMGCKELLIWHLEHLLTSFFTDIGVCSVVSFSLLSPSFCCPDFFFLFLKYIIIRVQLMSLTDSALTSSGPLLEVAGMNSYLGWGTFWTFLTEAKPTAPVPLKPCHITPPYRHISFSFRSLWSTGNPSSFWL